MVDMFDEPEPKQMISWIIWYRKRTGAGLAEAKEAWDKIHRNQKPDRNES